MKLTLGKVSNNGSHVERAKTPPSVWGDVNARRKQQKNIRQDKILNIIPVWRATAPPLIII
jgi:hypothetical protein